jgi:hypothetical protein
MKTVFAAVILVLVTVTPAPPADALGVYSYTAEFTGSSYNYCTQTGSLGVSCNVYAESFTCVFERVTGYGPSVPDHYSVDPSTRCRAELRGATSGTGLASGPCDVRGNGTLTVTDDLGSFSMPVTLAADGDTLVAVGLQTAATTFSTPACAVAPTSGMFQGTATYLVGYG